MSLLFLLIAASVHLIEATGPSLPHTGSVGRPATEREVLSVVPNDDGSEDHSRRHDPALPSSPDRPDEVGGDIEGEAEIEKCGVALWPFASVDPLAERCRSATRRCLSVIPRALDRATPLRC